MGYMESQMQSRYDVAEQMLNDYFEELEELVCCCCMAAGVSSDQFVVTPPKIVSNFDFNICVSSYISFKPEQILTKRNLPN